MLGDGRLAQEVGLHQVVVEVYVADEGGCGVALFEVVEAEDVRCEGRVATSRQRPTAGWSTDAICPASSEGQTE
jgi:hypothetical protein